MAVNVNSDINSKVYAVIKQEIKDLMKMSNEYFDIRHNDYLNDIFNNLSAKYNPRKTPQNTANQRYKGGKTTMIKMLFICHGSTAEMRCISG